MAVPLQEYLQQQAAQNQEIQNPKSKIQNPKIWGTSPDSIDMAENRERFEKILQELNIAQPPNGMARSYEDALIVAKRIGY
ncbi:MAG: hypothetical protein RLZZ86_1893, partial [Cyanobacteriota bacterium]